MGQFTTGKINNQKNYRLELNNFSCKLEDKLLLELRPGTRVISNTFLFYQVRLSKRDGKALLYIFSPENTQVEFIKKQLKSSAEEIEQDR